MNVPLTIRIYASPTIRHMARDLLRFHKTYLIIHVGLARLARKARLVGSFIFVNRACCARLTCLTHDSRTTKINPAGGGPKAVIRKTYFVKHFRS